MNKLTIKERKEMMEKISFELKNQGHRSLGTVWLEKLTDEELRAKYEEVCK